MRIVATMFVLVSVGLLACSSSETTPDNAGTPDADASTDTSPQQETGPADSAPDDSGTAHLGRVFAISDSTTVDGGVIGYHRAGASFVNSVGSDTATTTKTVGPCLLETIGDGKSPVETDVSAGSLHIKGGIKTIDLVPKANGTYEPVSGNESLWTGGETLTLTSDGDQVPTFSTTLVAPSKLTITAPVLSSDSMEVTRNAPLLATWTGGSSGEVVIYFDLTTSSKVFAVTCKYSANNGSATIPAAAFADFPAGTGFFNFYVTEASTATPSGWDIRFSASSAIVDPSGTSMIGTAVFK